MDPLNIIYNENQFAASCFLFRFRPSLRSSFPNSAKKLFFLQHPAIEEVVATVSIQLLSFHVGIINFKPPPCGLAASMAIKHFFLPPTLQSPLFWDFSLEKPGMEQSSRTQHKLYPLRCWKPSSGNVCERDITAAAAARHKIRKRFDSRVHP